jgi:hypothetical protein
MAAIQIGDYVIYENFPFMNSDGVKTLHFDVIKVKGIEIENGDTFVDNDNIIREKYRVRTIFRENQRIENDDFDELQIQEEMGNFLEKAKRE